VANPIPIYVFAPLTATVCTELLAPAAPNFSLHDVFVAAVADGIPMTAVAATATTTMTDRPLINDLLRDEPATARVLLEKDKA
jgi:hypothetical protein